MIGEGRRLLTRGAVMNSLMVVRMSTGFIESPAATRKHSNDTYSHHSSSSLTITAVCHVSIIHKSKASSLVGNTF